MGVDGFREDVITYISKKEGLPDDHLFPIYKGMPCYNHGPHIHEYLMEFKKDVLDHYDCFTLAEAPLVSPNLALKYIDEEKGQMDMMIQFQCQCADCLFTDYLPTKFSLRKLKRAFSSWQYKLAGKAWNMLYLENHDHPRILPRYGNVHFWKESGKMLATALLFQQGTPFIYQGQEIGMLNWEPENADMYEDVQTRYTYAHSNLNQPEEVRLKKMWRSSRDSARTPVQWDDSANAGFTTGTPWFYVNENYTHINVAQQEEDPDSILNFYRKAIHLRKNLPVVRHGAYREHYALSSKLYCYSRTMEDQRILVVCSFSNRSISFKAPKGFDLSTAELILCNVDHSEEKKLNPYECRVYAW
jgi:oligo-1,6-glucosidase